MRPDATTIARWAKAAIAHAGVEAISDPAGSFATVPVCRALLRLIADNPTHNGRAITDP